MKKTITCPICGLSFETEKNNKKYCSLNCREARKIMRQMEFKATHPEYAAEYMKQYRQRKKEM